MPKQNVFPSVTKNQHSFAASPAANIPRSVLPRNCGMKTTIDAGILYPVFVDEVLPGDTFHMDATLFGRLATLLKPIMDNLFLDLHFWFVPNRLTWTNWERFCGAQDNPDDTTDYTIPEITVPGGGFAELSLWDYLDVPPGIDHGLVDALIPRAYNLIWNEWYRDENLQDSVTVNTDDGPDADTDYQLLPRGKRKDYFTAALPFLQKGPSVEIPIGTAAPLIATGTGVPTFDGAGSGTGVNLVGGNLAAAWSATSSGAMSWNDPALEADLSAATAATINQLRLSFQVQRLYERDARGGTRYVELLKSHFGVTSPDFRLQRPEYLGGSTMPITINPVATTLSSALSSPPLYTGDLAAYSTSVGTAKWVKSFVEHGYIIGLASVRADLNYQQGLHRMWTRQTRWDFYWPALAHLGEQAVLNREIYAQGTSADEDVFGYQERWAEYRYKPSVVTGQYRSTNSVPLDVWHLAQEFSALPELGPDFIVEDPPISRVVADNTQPALLVDGWFKYTCARPMPTYSVPGLIDHF